MVKIILKIIIGIRLKNYDLDYNNNTENVVYNIF